MSIRPMHIDEIGGARARQTFFTAGRQMRRGEEIPLEQLRQWPTMNRNVMIEKGYIEVWPKSVSFSRPEPAVERDDEPEANTQRIIVPRGFGRYDVIEGVVLASNVDKDRAHAIAGTPLAGQPAPPAKAAPGRRRSGNPQGRPRAQDAVPPPMPAGVGPREDDESNGPIT